MAVECTCTKCASRYRLDDRFVGKKVRCKKCGEAIYVGSTDDGINLDDIAALATESMSGQSAAGRSAAGKSAAGHSAAGRSAAGRSSVAKAPVMQQSVIFEREDDLVSAPVTRAPRQPIKGLETPLISDQLAGLLSIICLLLFFALTGYFSYQGYQLGTSALAKSPLLDKLGTLTTVDTVTRVACFLVLLVPAVILSVAIGSGVDKRNSPPLDLIRAAGVAALMQSIILGLSILNNQHMDAGTGVMAIVLGILAAFVGIKEFMQLRIKPAALACAIFAVTGFAATLGGGTVRQKVVTWYQGDPTTQQPAQQPTVVKNTNPAPATPAAPTPPPMAAVDPYANSLRDLIPRIDQRLTETQSMTREQLTGYWQPQIDHFSKLTPREDSVLYTQYAERITKIKSMIAAAPTSEAPPEVFAALENAAEMSNSMSDSLQLDQAVKFGPVMISPLKNARLDLAKYSQHSTIVSWTLDKVQGNPRVTLTLIPRRQEKQTRPWVLSNKSVQTVAESKGFYCVDMASPMEIVVKIGGIAMSRLSADPATAPITERRVYAGVVENQFVELSITHELPGDKASLDAMEVMARSLHIAAAGETGPDAWDPAAIVARFDDDFEHAGPVIESIGEPAEDAVLAWAKASGKPPTPAVTALIRKIGTRKSAAFLASFAGSGPVAPGGVAMPPKPIEKPIIPAATVLEKFDLEIDQHKKLDMLESLTRQTPGDNRVEIAKLLEGIILSQGNERYLPEAAKALAIWNRPETIDAMLPLLKKDAYPAPYRRAAITALGGTKNQKVIMPVILCVQDEPDTTVAALINLGPMAETDVIKLLRENDANVRRSGARVLKEIGTVKSVVPLKQLTGGWDPVFDEALAAIAERRRAGGK